MKMKSLIYVLLLSSMVWVGCDDDDNGGRKDLAEIDEDFAEDAALSNMTEVDLANLAVEQATHQEVVAFAHHMIEEHTMAQNELKSIGDKYDDIDWPDEMTNENNALKAQLALLTGYKFDSAYMSSQVAAHEKASTLFSNEATNGKEDAIRGYAQKYLPHINEHLESAEVLYTKLLNDTGDPDGD